MRFCLEVWGTDYEKIKDTCILAEKLGYYGFYYGESLAEIDLDCWSVISNLSAITTTIKLGPVITYLIPQYRNIALLAKQSATLQEISNGRLEFRTGAGATHNYATQWWYPFGIDYPNTGERVSLLDEGLEVLRLLLSKSEVHFSGKYFKINGARLKLLYSKNNSQLEFEHRILTSIVAHAIIVYQYIHNLSNNFSSCCEASDI